MRGIGAIDFKNIRAGAALMLGAAIVSSFIGRGGSFSDEAPLLLHSYWFYILQLLGFPLLGAAVGIIYSDTRVALENAKYKGILCFCCMATLAFLQLPLLFGTRDIEGINAPAAALFAALFAAVVALPTVLWFSKLSKISAAIVFVYFLYEVYFAFACIILLINSIIVV